MHRNTIEAIISHVRKHDSHSTFILIDIDGDEREIADLRAALADAPDVRWGLIVPPTGLPRLILAPEDWLVPLCIGWGEPEPFTDTLRQDLYLAAGCFTDEAQGRIGKLINCVGVERAPGVDNRFDEVVLRGDQNLAGDRSEVTALTMRPSVADWIGRRLIEAAAACGYERGDL
jgi:hypothetical protein